MKKNIKIIISIILCLIIIGLGIFKVYHFYITKDDDAIAEKKSYDFIKALNYIQNENYIEAYNTVKDTNSTDLNIIQTIIWQKFTSQIDEVVSLDNKIFENFNEIVNYLAYPRLYSKNPIYQQNIDKIYDEEYVKLLDMKNKIPKNILFEDCASYYDSYFQFLDIENGVFRDVENQTLYNKSNLQARIIQITENLTQLSGELSKLKGQHPSSVIPEEYRRLFSF